MKLSFSQTLILISLLSIGLSFSQNSQAQVTMENGFGFNNFETAYGSTEIGVMDNIVSIQRDDKLNRTVVNNSSFSASATAIGNLVNVVTVGSGNTTVVHARQQNTGNQTATVSLSNKSTNDAIANPQEQQLSPSTAAAATSSTAK